MTSAARNGRSRRKPTKSVPRVTVDPGRMGGVPCVRDLRVPVSTIVGMVAERMSEADILAAYPDLTAEDIRSALQYAARAVEDRAVVASR
jgi:uncharacterized protein (DUF433 family)